jgi:hypothetical protein
MNKTQRVVLIIGAIALLIFIFTTPQYYIFPNWRIDLGAGVLRAIAVIGATLLVTYALKDKKEKKS